MRQDQMMQDDRHRRTSARPTRALAGLAAALAAGSALVLVATLAAAVPGQAQDAAAWRVECTGDGKTLDCRAVQQLYQRETRQLVVSLLVRKGSGPRDAHMTIQLPLGLNLTEPILLKVDSGPAEKSPIQTCTNIGCFVSMNANDKLVAAMRSGHEIKITVFDGNKKPIEMSLPLLGFGIAFDKARS
jgi:invasion protein IalB